MESLLSSSLHTAPSKHEVYANKTHTVRATFTCAVGTKVSWERTSFWTVLLPPFASPLAVVVHVAARDATASHAAQSPAHSAHTPHTRCCYCDDVRSHVQYNVRASRSSHPATSLQPLGPTAALSSDNWIETKVDFFVVKTLDWPIVEFASALFLPIKAAMPFEAIKL